MDVREFLTKNVNPDGGGYTHQDVENLIVKAWATARNEAALSIAKRILDGTPYRIQEPKQTTV